MEKVQQEFLIAKAALGIEPTRDNDLNFIAIYVTNDDKASQFCTFPSRFHIIYSPHFVQYTATY
jgi:hypothetical protein